MMASTLLVRGIEAIVLRAMSEQPMSWESVVPVELLRMPAEPETADRLLDDERFLARTCVCSCDVGAAFEPDPDVLATHVLKYRYR